MVNDNDDEPTTSRRGMMKYMGMCAAAAAAAPVAQEKASENANGKGLGRTPPGQEDEEEDEEEEEAEEEDETPESDVTFEDQTVEGGETEVGIAEKWEQNSQGYLSLHDYDRFSVADGEDLDEAAAEVAEDVDGIDPEEVDLEEPAELEYPICQSMIGITERFDAGEYKDVEVPLLRDDSPAVELGAREAGALDSSEVLICIPHFDSTGNEEFVCPDDPNTPSVQDEPEEVDGAYFEGDQHVESIGVSHDLGIIFIGEEDEEDMAEEVIKKRLIEDGVLVPQALASGEEQEEVAEEGDEEEDEEEEDGEADHPQVGEDVPTGKFEDDVHGTLTVNVTFDGEPAVRHPVEMNGEQFRTDENGQSVYELGPGHGNPEEITVEVGDQEETAEVGHDDDNDDVTLDFEV